MADYVAQEALGDPPSASAGGVVSADKLLYVLQHSLGRDRHGRRPGGAREDYRNHFCASAGHADFVTCRDAVRRGLMRECAPREISGGDSIFTVTVAGVAYVDANSSPPPKLTRGQARYKAFLRADCGLSFGEWLRAGGRS